MLQKCSLWKVAEVFFIEPARVHYVKEISKKIGLAHTSIKNHLATLVKEGLIEPSQGDIYKGYKARREAPPFVFYKKISNQVRLQESGLLDALKEKFPQAIILFGSFNKGEDIDSSDIDIYVNEKRFKVDTKKYEGYLKRRLHLIFKEDGGKELMASINQGTLLFGER